MPQNPSYQFIIILIPDCNVTSILNKRTISVDFLAVQNNDHYLSWDAQL
jgi:hypothetical protein